MTNPPMHCVNPNCVDDNCHGECRDQNEKLKDIYGNSFGFSLETEEEIMYCEDS